MRALMRASWTDRALLAEAGACLALARLAVRCLPFGRIAARLGDHTEESERTHDADHARVGRRVGWAIGAVSARVPWRARCLEQALAGKAMLRRRRISNTMYLGVARAANGGQSPLDAHAWLRTGTVHVTGGARVERYVVLSTFADHATAGDRSSPPLRVVAHGGRRLTRQLIARAPRATMPRSRARPRRVRR